MYHHPDFSESAPSPRLRFAPATYSDAVEIVAMLQGFQPRVVSDELEVILSYWRNSIIASIDRCDARVSNEQEVNDEYFVAREANGQFAAAVRIYDQGSFLWGIRGLKNENILYFNLMKPNPEENSRGADRELITYVAQIAMNRQKNTIRCDLAGSYATRITFYESVGFINHNFPGDPVALLEAQAQAVTGTSL